MGLNIAHEQCRPRTKDTHVKPSIVCKTSDFIVFLLVGVGPRFHSSLWFALKPHSANRNAVAQNNKTKGRGCLLLHPMEVIRNCFLSFLSSTDRGCCQGHLRADFLPSDEQNHS